MIPSQFEEEVAWLEDRWPGTKNYKNWARVAYDFIGIPQAAMREASETFYNTGAKMAPAISELRSAAAEIAVRRGLTDPNATNCDIQGRHGNLAIDELSGDRRRATCVLCGSSWVRAAVDLPTVGEVDRGLASVRRAKTPEMEQAEMELSDRIAP